MTWFTLVLLFSTSALAYDDRVEPYIKQLQELAKEPTTTDTYNNIDIVRELNDIEDAIIFDSLEDND